MSFTAVLYEGDSVAHFAPRIRTAVNTRSKTPNRGAKIQCLTRPSRSLGRGRSRRGAIEVLIGAIWNAVRSVGQWIEEKSSQAHYRRVESYLAQSTNHADLERRMRELDHNSHLNWIDCGSR